LKTVDSTPARYSENAGFVCWQATSRAEKHVASETIGDGCRRSQEVQHPIHKSREQVRDGDQANLDTLNDNRSPIARPQNPLKLVATRRD
jgi:hypothetical protein